ncbi:hypothetical protein X737_14790 [Mesorhizobium sp. L48C026A00]|nr:hypothetical protein X737_14790 [Mesorhizobium sp. L48C026A00]
MQPLSPAEHINGVGRQMFQSPATGLAKRVARPLNAMPNANANDSGLSHLTFA